MIALAILQAVGVVSGTVRDPVGSVMPGVTVKLNGDKGTTAVTDTSGRFRLAGVGSGAVAIEATLAGFEPATSTVTLPSGGAVDVTLVMHVRGPRPGRAFEDIALRVAIAAGEGATACGSHPLSSRKAITLEQLETFVVCARESLAAGRAFYLIVQSPGMDSRIYTGLFAARGGVAQYFSFDSGPCGNEFDCDPRYVVTPCATPRAEFRGGWPGIVCAAG
ncbi:MAG: carboxypeptidase regulatory-like domain-containing protein [Acidobacteria bacterium]|nr:carboxypeptidase regulatory-like domain-containing protein [Acidobacteriota bacterium]